MIIVKFVTPELFNEGILESLKNIEITDNDGYITCPYCGNIIKINNYERYPL